MIETDQNVIFYDYPDKELKGRRHQGGICGTDVRVGTRSTRGSGWREGKPRHQLSSKCTIQSDQSVRNYSLDIRIKKTGIWNDAKSLTGQQITCESDV